MSSKSKRSTFHTARALIRARGRHLRGGKPRLTSAQVERVRARYATGSESIYTLAATFKVSTRTITRTLHGEGAYRVRS